jgi:hypothetical protein
MGELFRVPNWPDLNLQDTTVMTAEAASGQKIINTIGVKGMAHDDLGLLGAPGSLVGEIHKINTITSLAITFVENLINNHRKTEPFTIIAGDQIKCYRAPNVNNYAPDDSTFTLLGSANDIDADSPITIIRDSTGGTGYWYKFTYFNSVSSVETPLASSIAVRGGGFGHYVSGEDIRREAGLLTNQQIADTQISARRDHAESEVNGTLAATGYLLPLVDGQGNYYTPGIIENITRLLAAGYVLTQDYGPISGGNSKDGETKLKQAHDLLMAIQERKSVLTDSVGQLMATSTRITGYPDDSTKDAGPDGVTPEPAFFSIGKKF